VTGTVSVEECYDQLRQQDVERQSMTEVDPSLDDMKQRHDQEITAAKKTN
jgi:hypothetical protein